MHRPNSDERLYISKIYRQVEKTIKVTADKINIMTSLLLVPTFIRMTSLGLGLELLEFVSTSAQSLFESTIWLKTIPTIVVWETNSGALSNASRYEVTDSSELPESGIDMVTVSS